uniref:Uncharacterized protein n=1 Tax=Arundo donax TaxID=35708 RepID=A0A0A9DAR5_ARUDO
MCFPLDNVCEYLMVLSLKYFCSKKYPKDLPKVRPTREMGAIEKALHNAPSRETKYIFEPTPGTTFDSVAEAQELYNLYSWEVGFGTKKGDKHASSMQELHCQCKGEDPRIQYVTKKRRCPAMIRLHRTIDLG